MSVSNHNLRDQPMMEMNTTPLIDVLLVLLIMFIMTIPPSLHSIDIDLPVETEAFVETNAIQNHIALTSDDAILWNGNLISLAQLPRLLKAALDYPVEPELQFEPEPQASYDVAVKVLAMIKSSQMTKFGIVGNDRYGEFNKASNQPTAQ